MSPLPPAQPRCRKLARRAGLQVWPLGPVMVSPAVQVRRGGEVLAELPSWDAAADWLIQHTTG